jgi:hypothetical protein
VKFLDALLGRSKPAQPKLDALFGVTGAAVTLEASAGLKPTGQAAVCFKPASGQGFAAASEELRGLLDLAVKEAGSTLRLEDDRYGYRWVVVGDPDLEDLVTAVHLVNATLEQYGFGPQLLCSVFGFAEQGGGSGGLKDSPPVDRGSGGLKPSPPVNQGSGGLKPSPPVDRARRCHLVYLYKRGTFYPFAPQEGERRDNELELQVRAALGGDLPIEPELGRWFALWGIPL